MTCVLTCMIFAAVSGSSVATTFAIGAILIPALVKHGYPKTYAAALQATSAELGVVIPPSIPMILFGVSAEVSIGELFVAGFGPGPADRRRADAVRPPVLPLEGLGQAGRRRPPWCRHRHAAGRLGAADAGDHPRRHLWWRLHADRGGGGRGLLCAHRRHGGAPRAALVESDAGTAQVGHLECGDHVHHRQCRTVRLPDHPRRHPGCDRHLADRRARSHRPISCSASMPRCS